MDNIANIFFPKLTRRAKYSTKPDGGYYSYDYYRRKFSHEIREDCLCRCVYCDLKESYCGGAEAMNADHFRPRGIVNFAPLTDNPNNLVWSCPVCNRLKSDNWPCTSETGTMENDEGFIDPFEEDRSNYFQVDIDGGLVPLKPPAVYLIGLLGLNRQHCRRSRRILILKMQCKQLIDELEHLFSLDNQSSISTQTSTTQHPSHAAAFQELLLLLRPLLASDEEC